MRFLTKDSSSEILKKGLTYKKGQTQENRRLKELLIHEQKGFCAYTERYVESTIGSEVEHFDPLIKYRDDYFNYYAVVRTANLRKEKKETQYKGASFFDNRFFQIADGFSDRIRYILPDHVYEERDPSDAETAALIDYLGFNDRQLVEDRRRHVKKLTEIFIENDWSEEIVLTFLRRNPPELSFITALAEAVSIKPELLLRTPGAYWGQSPLF